MRADIEQPWSEIMGLVQSKSSCFNLKGVSILDIGCGPATGVFDFFAKVGFARYVGVDNRARENGWICHENYSSLRNEGVLVVPELSEFTFNEIFSVHDSTEAGEFLATCNEQFDIIVLSNLLHLRGVREYWRNLLRSSMGRLKPAGSVYVKVFIEAYETCEECMPFNDAEIQQMAMMFSNIDCVEVMEGARKVRLFGQRGN